MTVGVLFPMLILGGAGFLVPLWTVSRSAAKVGDVTRGIVLASLIMFALAFFIGAWVFVLNGAGLHLAMQQAPVQTLSLLAVLAFKSALIWAPILAFMWLHLATRANKLAGEIMAREGQSE